MAPEDKDEWVTLYQDPPSVDELQISLKGLESAFQLDSDGPAFMQDFDLLEKVKPATIAALLIDSPGASTIKDNTDHFVKAGRVNEICLSCAAIGIFTLQINGPAGGSGHRVGLRGGGPLTTLVMPSSPKVSLWEKVWINVLSRDDWEYDLLGVNKNVFPWMGPAIISDEDQVTYPENVHPLHCFWGTPRRIRLHVKKEYCCCDLCGQSSDSSVSEFSQLKHGFNYGGPWTHPLTPYRFDPKKPNRPPYSRKAQKDGVSYRYWEALTFRDKKEKGYLPAAVVLDYSAKRDKADDMELDIPAVCDFWVFGYDMKSMKPRCWYSSHMPLLALPDERKVFAQLWLRKMINLTDVSAGLLQKHIKEAWFSEAKSTKRNAVKKDVSHIGAALWESTEQDFYQYLMEIGDMLSSAAPPERFPQEIARQWYRIVTGHATDLFDNFSLSGPAEQLDMERITKARNIFRENIYTGKDAKDFRKIGHLDEGRQ